MRCLYKLRPSVARLKLEKNMVASVNMQPDQLRKYPKPPVISEIRPTASDLRGIFLASMRLMRAVSIAVRTQTTPSSIPIFDPQNLHSQSPSSHCATIETLTLSTLSPRPSRGTPQPSSRDGFLLPRECFGCGEWRAIPGNPQFVKGG